MREEKSRQNPSSYINYQLSQMSHMCMCAVDLLQMMSYLDFSRNLRITTSLLIGGPVVTIWTWLSMPTAGMQSTRRRQTCDMLVIAPTDHLLARKP